MAATDGGMPAVAARVADFIESRFAAAHAAPDAPASVPEGPFLVALAGVPGSGKTTLSALVARLLNARAPSSSAPRDVRMGGTTVMPMDGYHLTRAQLDAMPNPTEAHARRGAPFTFDPSALARDLCALRSTGRLAAPSFDHARKDPCPGAIRIDAATTRDGETAPGADPTRGDGGPELAPSASVTRGVVLVEGLYLCLSAPAEWAAVTAAFDARVFLAADLDDATERLTLRHMAAWGMPREEAYGRASGSDRLNAELVDADRAAADLVVAAVADPEWARQVEAVGAPQ